MPKYKKPFEVLVEAKLAVDAFDETAARTKVERAFADGRVIADDVSATANTWTYDVVALPNGD
jgi:hypothetical protein